jgi:hypothetical protein
VAKSKILYSNHSRNFTEIQSSVYYEDPCSSAKNLCSVTCLYFSRLIPCLFTKALSKCAIVCSIKNVITISWYCRVAIHLRSLFSSFWHFALMKCFPHETFL